MNWFDVLDNADGDLMSNQILGPLPLLCFLRDDICGTMG